MPQDLATLVMTRQDAMRLAGNRCVDCGSADNIQVHHDIPGDNTSLIPLCAYCHSLRHPQYLRPLILARKVGVMSPFPISGVRRVFRHGNSLVMTLPNEWTSFWGLKDGDEVGVMSNRRELWVVVPE